MRYPLPLLSGSDSEKLRQLQSYLYRLVEHLNSGAELSELPRQKVQVASVNSPVGQFAAIKSLIIKSADIISAYTDAIEKKLQGKYVAQSEFGQYMEETEATLSADAKQLSVLFENTESIQSALDSVESTLQSVNARLKVGLLYYDESDLPVYGLEIGQRTTKDGSDQFHKYARFTSECLCFYDKNDVAVAYISDYKLHVSSAVIEGDLHVGGYILSSEDGLAFSWVG